MKLLADGGWGNTDKMETLVKSIQSSNSIRYAIDEAVEHVDKALEAIKPYHGQPDYELLADLARYIVDRNH